ncbi:Rap/ran-GAP [Penicillium concentricum]|uniref:Rap/ran-GAP n=1 Tax=Penicillium concentricum TaxID=293559 RepID=A0A9W9SBD6_9EURO|nr:Rap/ran-GAP [Penicillium concentricum]KAJ5375528.1 Rap/ran-GAP [Penicillium concentricum]
MSPDDAPPLSQHKHSSTSFADVFKTLGVGRPKSQSPVSLQESSSDSQFHTDSRGTTRLGYGFESMHRASVVSSSSDPPSVLDFETSLHNLSQRQNLTQAIEEAEGLSKGLSCFNSEQSILLWEAAEYLLRHESSLDAQQSGARLLEAVAARQDLPPSARRLVFESITSSTEPDVIAARVQSLISLSDHGRKLDFAGSSIIHIISSWIVPFYETIASARSKAKKGKVVKPHGPADDEAVFGDLFQFAVDLITLQRKQPTQEEIEMLLAEIFTTCRRTSVAADIKNSLAVFDAVIMYADVPDVSFPTLLEVLCSIHASVKPLSGPTSRAVRSLAKSRRQAEMVNTLHGFLRDSCAVEGGRNLNILRGTLYVFSDFVRAYGQDGMPQLPFDQLIESLQAIAEKDDGRVDADLLDLCLNILEGDYVRVALERDWMAFANLLILCSRRLVDESTPSPTSPTSPQLKPTYDETKSYILANLIRIASVLESQWEQLNREQKQHAVRFLMKIYQHIEPPQAELIIHSMRKDKICHPSDNFNWAQHCRELVECFVQPRKQSSDIRILALDTLKEALSAHEDLLFSHEHGLLGLLLKDFSAEHDLLFLESLVSLLTDQATQYSDDDTFKLLVSTIGAPIQTELSRDEPHEHPPSHGSQRRTSTTSVLELSLTNVCAVGLVKMMLRALNLSSTKAVMVFEALLDIAQSPSRPVDSRLTVLKLLFRLRCDSAGSVTVISTSESDFLMNVLGRNLDGGSKLQAPSDSPTREIPQHDNSQVSPTGKIPSRESTSTPMSRSAPGRGSISARGSRLTAPVWTYALPQVLPEQPPGESSPVVFAYAHPEESAPGESTTTEPKITGLLKVKMWLEVVITLLQRETDWDVYSYILTHIGPQLGNKDFFRDAIPQITLLRSILCDQVKNGTFHEPPETTGLKKSDVAACIFDALCMLVSYHAHFAKSEEDDLVRAFMQGIIGSWGGTSRGCIQALSLCCYEIPMSVTKSLNSILDRMSKVITMSNIAVHILEFLALLARLPDVYVNLREEEIRTVFGICIRFLQTSREHRYKAAELAARASVSTQSPQSKLGGGAKEISALAPEAIETSQDGMSKYISNLTYHVMVFWFLSLKLQDRPKHVNWITSRLIYHDEHGKEVVEEQSQVFIDLMQRVAYSDLGETIPFETFPPSSEDGPVARKSWIVGMSIVTVESAGLSGLSQITKRQASGTTYSVYQQRTAPVLPHQVPPTPDAHLHSDSMRTAVLPSHIMLQLTATAFPTPTVMQPIPVPEDDITRRAISNFDRTDIVDGHRIGIVYVDNGQTKEAEILANTGGSADYENLLSGLGTKVSLRNPQFNPQGLYADTDGEHTYAWRDRVTEIVYHVATMMPTDFDRDPACINKKRNLGNNHVTIVFNRSNLPFNFDTIPSEFNSINIIITPSSRIAYDESGNYNGETDPQKLYYSVQVMSKPGFPDVSPAATPKVISGKNLAAFVRILALNASVFSLVWNNKGGEHTSSWTTRLREIKKVRERALTAQSQGSEAAEGAYPGLRRNTKANIFSEELPSRAPQVQTDFAAEWNAAADTNIVQNLDFSRWAR